MGKEANPGGGVRCGVQRVPAVSMADGLQLLVQLMTAAMTTEPCLSSYSSPQCRKGIWTFCFSLEMWKPLNPTCEENDWLDYPSQRQTGSAGNEPGPLSTFSSRQLWKSSFMLLTATLSWGLFGPLTWGTMELRLISITCSKGNHYYFPLLKNNTKKGTHMQVIHPDWLKKRVFTPLNIRGLLKDLHNF